MCALTADCRMINDCPGPISASHRSPHHPPEHHGKGGRQVQHQSNGRCSHIVIENSVIADWGHPSGGAGFGSGYGAGIRIDGASTERIIVQRNLFHDPATQVNSWCESRDTWDPVRLTGEQLRDYDPEGVTHPLGPAPIRMKGTKGNHVIRYNSFEADEDHEFHDIIGGENSGFSMLDDSDIYGNFIGRSRDNHIEADTSTATRGSGATPWTMATPTYLSSCCSPSSRAIRRRPRPTTSAPISSESPH
jgi:hypothetical protein